VELTPVLDVETTVVTVVDVAVDAEMLTLVVVVVVVVVLTTVETLVLVLGGGTFCKVNATMSPGVEPGHVVMASALQVPTGRRMYSCPLTEAPIDTLTSIGAPM